MAIPSAVNWPTSLDDATTLFGDPVNLAEFTLNGDIGAADVSFAVTEAVDQINVPVFLRFATGELVYAEAVDVPSKTFSVITRAVAGGTQSHNSGEIIRAVTAAQYFTMLKKAILALETEIGLSPSGAHASVVARLDDHDHSGGDDGAAVALASITGHTKAIHDALLIDADTVDGAHAAALYGEDTLYVRIFAHDTDVEVMDGAEYFVVPEKYDGKSITDVHIAVNTAPSVNPLSAQLHNLTDAVDVLSTAPTIDVGEYSSYTAATQPVVNGTNAILATGDVLRFDVDAANGAIGLDFIITIDMAP